MGDSISRQAAIEALKDMYHAAEKWGEEASDDVIKARAESCMASLVEMKLRIEKLPSAEPVRCKDCYYCISYKSFDKTYYLCDAFEAHAEGDLIGVSLQVTPDHYCSWAERRQDANISEGTL